MIKVVLFFTKLVVVVFIAVMFSSCRYHVNQNDDNVEGNGNIRSETRTINGDFQSISVQDAIEVVVEQSDDKSVVVEADENILPLITTRVENGVLIIEPDHGISTSGSNPKVTVKMPIIKKLTCGNSSSIRSINTIITDNLEVRAENASAIEINVEADNISLEAENSGTIHASGKALKLETSSSDGSELDARKLMANDVRSQANDGSSTSVYPIVSLNASAFNGSSIIYYKTPKTLSKESDSGASISAE